MKCSRSRKNWPSYYKGFVRNGLRAQPWILHTQRYSLQNLVCLSQKEFFNPIYLWFKCFSHLAYKMHDRFFSFVRCSCDKGFRNLRRQWARSLWTVMRTNTILQKRGSLKSNEWKFLATGEWDERRRFIEGVYTNSSFNRACEILRCYCGTVKKKLS